jgi:hypothetical protein
MIREEAGGFICPLYIRAGIAYSVETRDGLGGTVIESQCGKVFRKSSKRAWCPHGLLYNGDRVSFGGKTAGALR